MSKFACTCGHVISDVAVPNVVTGFVLSDKSAEVFYNTISDVVKDFLNHQNSGRIADWRAKHFNELYPADEPPSEMIHDVLTGRLMDVTLATMECDNCGRLWIQEAVGVNRYHGYSPDDTEPSRMKVLGLNHETETTSDRLVPKGENGSLPSD